MTHDVIVLLSALGVVGQVIAAALLLVAVLALFGVRGPLRAVCRAVEGYERAPRSESSAKFAFVKNQLSFLKPWKAPLVTRSAKLV